MLLFLSETLESNGIIKKQATNHLKLNIKKGIATATTVLHLIKQQRQLFFTYKETHNSALYVQTDYIK